MHIASSITKTMMCTPVPSSPVQKTDLNEDGQQDDPHQVEEPGRHGEDDVVIGDAPAPAEQPQARHC